MKIATVTPKIHLGDCEYNAGRIAEYAEKAGEEGCGLVVFPELVLTGSTCGDILGNADFKKNTAAVLEKIREKTTGLKDLTIVFGAPIYGEGTDAEGKFQNEETLVSVKDVEKASAVIKGYDSCRGKNCKSGIVLINGRKCTDSPSSVSNTHKPVFTE